MTQREAITITQFSGRAGGTNLTDTATGPEIRLIADRADGLVVSDPMSFPWEFFVDNPPRCPVVVDLTDCTTDDIVALTPALGCLTASDRLLGDPELVADVSGRLGLDDLWISRDTDLEEFAQKAGWSKRADVEERTIVSRLAKDPELQIVVVDGDTIRGASAGFAAVAIDLSEQLDGATIDTIWGIHPHPGQPLDRAVLAFRSADER